MTDQNTARPKTSPLLLVIPVGNALALASLEIFGSKGVLLMVLVAWLYQRLLSPRTAGLAQCLLYVTLYPVAFVNEMMNGGSPWTMPAIFFSAILALRLWQEGRLARRLDLLDHQVISG